MIVDTHSHYIPEVISDLLRKRSTAPFIERQSDGSEIRHFPTGNTLAYTDVYSDIKKRIALMDDLGVDHQVLSMGLLFGLHALPISEASEIAHVFNKDLSELCAAHPDRFSGLALLPMADIEVAAKEYRFACQELGLIGAILPANSFSDRHQADELIPIFETAQEIGRHIFIHPGIRPDEFLLLPGLISERVPRDNSMARRALEIHAKLAQAMVTLSFSDFLDPFSNVTVQLACLGGTLPMVIERMDHTIKSRTPGETLTSEKLGRVFLDCASLGPKAIEIAAAVYGADKLLLGTDNPIFPIEQALAAISASNLNGQEKSGLLGRNAEKFLKLVS